MDILVFACVDNGPGVNEVGGLVGDHLMVHVADVGISKPNIPEIISYCDPKTSNDADEIVFLPFQKKPTWFQGLPLPGRQSERQRGR